MRTLGFFVCAGIAFGAAEACWEFVVRDFRCVVAMDSHGTSLFARVAAESSKRLAALCP